MSNDQIRLGDIAVLEYGKSLPERERIQGDYYIYGSGGVVGTHKVPFINTKGIIVGRKGSIGKVYFSTKAFFPIDTVFYIARVNKNYDLKYYYYFLSNIGLEKLNSDAAVPGLNRNWVHSLKAYFPNYINQRKIAAILTAYDDLIENNNKQITILENMAENIYKEWFVRMRFPGYKKTKFVKGIPQDWEVKKIENIGKVVTGKTPSTKILKYYKGDYLFIKTPDMHNKTFILATDETLTKDGLNSQPSQTIPPDSICVSCIGTGGVVSLTTSICQTNQQINSVVLKKKHYREWAYYTLVNQKEQIMLFGATGATMTNLSKGKFSALKIIFPKDYVIKSFHELIESHFEEIKTLSLQNQKLIKTRNMLLPRLLNGKLKVENLDIKFPPSMENEDA